MILVFGCMKCADAILSKNYHGLPALSYDSTAKTEAIYPKVHGV